MSDQRILNPTAPTKVDAEGYTHGYCDSEGNFLGYAPYMTLVPNLIPAKFHVKSQMVVPTGNQRILPKGRILTTDAGFGGIESEKVMDGLVPNVGDGLAPTGGIPGTAIPEPEPEPEPEPAPGPVISPALAERIAARNTSQAAKNEGTAPAAKAADKPAADKPAAG